MNIEVIIADDHMLFVDGIKSILENQPGFRVVGFANDGRELLEVMKATQADIVLLDINMPYINGLEVLKYSRLHKLKPKIIMLSTYNETHFIEKARAGGASGYVIKNFNRDELTNAIEWVNSGKEYFPMKDIKLAPVNNEKDPFLRQFELTPRERQLLVFIGDGFTNKAISKKLNLSIFTIETHRKNIMQKLNLKSPNALIRFIIENNLTNDNRYQSS